MGKCTVTLYDCASKVGTWVGECSKRCVLSTLKSVGQNKQVKDKMWWWCDQASRNNFCSFWGEICGSCVNPNADGGEPVCCDYCLKECMERTGNRLEETESVTTSSSPSSSGDMKQDPSLTPKPQRFDPLQAVQALQANADGIQERFDWKKCFVNC